MPTKDDEYLMQLMRLGSYMSIMRFDKAVVAHVNFNCPLTHIPYRFTLKPSHVPVSGSVGFSGIVLGYEEVIIGVSPEVTIKMQVPVIDISGDLPVIGKDFLEKANVKHILCLGTSTRECDKLVMSIPPSALFIPVFSSREMLEEDHRAAFRSIALNNSHLARYSSVRSALESKEIIFDSEASESGILTTLGQQCELVLEISQPQKLNTKCPYCHSSLLPKPC